MGRADETTVDEGLDRAAVRDTLAAFFVHLDWHEFDAAAALLDGGLTLDVSALFGAEPQVRSADEWAVAWRESSAKFDGEQHLVGAVSVDALDEESATARFPAAISYFVRNDAGGATWAAGTHYRVELKRREGGWRIARFEIRPAWSSGDPTVMALVVSNNAE